MAGLPLGARTKPGEKARSLRCAAAIALLYPGNYSNFSLQNNQLLKVYFRRLFPVNYITSKIEKLQAWQ